MRRMVEGACAPTNHRLGTSGRFCPLRPTPRATSPASGGGTGPPAHRLQAGAVAPQPAAHFTQRFARPPGEAQRLAGRDLATADGGE
jgi:hypothetical protein